MRIFFWTLSKLRGDYRSGLFLIGIIYTQIFSLNHTVTDFRQDFSGNSADTVAIDPLFGDSLILQPKLHVLIPTLPKILTDGVGNNGQSGVSPVVSMSRNNEFKVAYVSWSSQHTPAPAVTANPTVANIVVRTLTMNENSIDLETQGNIIAGNENPQDVNGIFYGGTPNVRPPPFYFSYSASGNRYSAYWGSSRVFGPIRRTSHADAIGNDPNTYGKYLLPTAPIVDVGYGEINSSTRPGSNGNETVVAYEKAFNPGEIELRWENLDLGITTATSFINGTINRDQTVAQDSAGNTVVLMRVTNAMSYSVFNAAHAQVVGPTLIANPIFVMDSINVHNYRPYALIAVSNGHFILCYGKNRILYYRTLQIPFGSLTQSLGAETRLTGLTELSMWPSLAVNNQKIIFSWFKKLDTDNHRLMLARFNLLNNTLDLPSRFDLDIAGEGIGYSSVGNGWYNWHYFKTPIVALDSNGNCVAAYENGFHAKIAMARNTTVYHDSGFFQSKILTVSNPALNYAFNPLLDSVQFLLVVQNPVNLLPLKIAFSSDGLFNGAASALNPFVVGMKSNAGFYRYRLDLQSSIPSGDSLKTRTPKSRGLTFSFNTKPHAVQIDSIKIGANAMIAFQVGQAYSVATRRDTVKLVCSGFDMDDADSLIFTFSSGSKIIKRLSSTQKISTGLYRALFTIPPQDTITSAYPFLLVARDDLGWTDSTTKFSLSYNNSPPTLAAKIFKPQRADSAGFFIRTGNTDTLLQPQGKLLSLQQGDTARVQVILGDANQDALQFLLKRNGVVEQSLASKNGDTLNLRLLGDTNTVGVDAIRLQVGDKDSVITLNFSLLLNRQPILDSVAVVGKQNLQGIWQYQVTDKIVNQFSDFDLNIPAGILSLLKAGFHDADINAGDSLKAHWTIWRPKPGCSGGQLSCYSIVLQTDDDSLLHNFQPQEEYLTLRVTDNSGAFFEKKIKLNFPFLDTSQAGGNSFSHLDSLAQKLQFIIGNTVNTQDLNGQITNLGTVPLLIDSVITMFNDQKWLQIILQWKVGPKDTSITISQHTNNNSLLSVTPISLESGHVLKFTLHVFSDSLKGDSILIDTLFIKTNDNIVKVLKIPVQLVYNDLPLLRLTLVGDTSVDKNGFYNSQIKSFLPTQSKLLFSFSEPVRKVKWEDKIKVYSLLDSIKNPIRQGLIAGLFRSAKKSLFLAKKNAQQTVPEDSLVDSVFFTPQYDHQSEYFGVLAPLGSFIHRDKLRIRISNSLTDAAGNALDLRLKKNAVNAGSYDTTFELKVDTNSFYVFKTFPLNNTLSWEKSRPLEIRFNRALNKINQSLPILDLQHLQGDSNLSIHVTSTFHPNFFHNFKFIHLAHGDSSLIFKNDPELTAFDKVTVTLSSKISDILGYSLDGNGDGLPRFYYNPQDTTDQFQFTFVVQPDEFYVFPNPFKFSDARHREKGNITFKNIMALKGFEALKGYKLGIHSMSGDLLYSEHSDPLGNFLQTGIRDRGSISWDVKNNHGLLVGTGVYLYTLEQDGGRLLQKGKIAIIR